MGVPASSHVVTRPQTLCEYFRGAPPSPAIEMACVTRFRRRFAYALMQLIRTKIVRHISTELAKFVC